MERKPKVGIGGKPIKLTEGCHIFSVVAVEMKKIKGGKFVG